MLRIPIPPSNKEGCFKSLLVVKPGVAISSIIQGKVIIGEALGATNAFGHCILSRRRVFQ